MIITKLDIKKVKENQKVLYIPKDGPAETGVVKSWNKHYVFVNYFKENQIDKTAKATRFQDLFYLD